MSESSTGPRPPGLAAAYAAIYPMLVPIARAHGYCLAVHGSLARDFDLVAVPWTDEASDALTLITALKVATATVTHHAEMDHHFPSHDPEEKPHGRLAYSLHCTNRGCEGAYLDVSVMPRMSPNHSSNNV